MGNLTIVSAPTTSRLTTIDNVRDELLGTVVDTSRDRVLYRMMDAASRAIADYCNRVFGRGQYIEEFRLDLSKGWLDREEISNSLSLKRWPVVSIDSITDYYGDTIDPTFYELNTGAGIVHFVPAPYGSTVVGAWGNSQPSPRYPLKVTYTAGWDLAAEGDGSAPLYAGIPADLESTALGLITQGYLAQGTDTRVILEVTENVGRTGYDKSQGNASSMSLDAGMKDVLMAYKAMR
jgi:hypothetical protein